MTGQLAKPFCGLCNEPKFRVADVWMCEHCDTTVHCIGQRCGACKQVQEKTYPALPDDRIGG